MRDPQPDPGGTKLTSAGGSAGGSSVSGAGKFHVCNDPAPLDGGWQRCANGLVHRPVVGECTSQLPRTGAVDPAVLQRAYPGYVAGSGMGGSPGLDRPSCERDSDCTAQPYGHCELGGAEQAAVICEYGCIADSDCREGYVCACDGGPIGSCVQSSCSSDADCAGDALCAGYTADPGCNLPAVACQTPRDTCATKADCGERQECTMDRNSLDPAWHCAERTCSIGRPFLIDGSARLAPCEARADWLATLGAADNASDPAGDLDSEARAAVAGGWLQQALMEHASVAAFARFSLQLLSLGAPAELVRAAAQAQADEIAHAQDCFALARRYGAGDVGPGPLPLAGALDETDLRGIVLGTIAEGCIGETLAALEAAEACSHCTDPAARNALERIAADETRHAQLAWRFVAWALETGPAGLPGEVRAAFARALTVPPAVPACSELDRRLLQHGLMSDALRSALRARVLRDVIAPCADALLTSANSASSAHPTMLV